MTDRPRTTRWRPRISLRTLLALVTLAGLYFGCWELTKRLGVRQVVRVVDDEFAWATETNSPFPLVVSTYVTEIDLDHDPLPVLLARERRHYVWVPGLTAPLPNRFTTFVEAWEDCWYDWTHEDSRLEQNLDRLRLPPLPEPSLPLADGNDQAL